MKIAVIDDHRMFRDSVVSFFTSESFCDGAFSAASVAEGKALVAERHPTVAPLDMSFPGEGGVALVEWIRTKAPETACVFLTMHEELAHLR